MMRINESSPRLQIVILAREAKIVEAIGGEIEYRFDTVR
jgi:hypothetical protein